MSEQGEGLVVCSARDDDQHQRVPFKSVDRESRRGSKSPLSSHSQSPISTESSLDSLPSAVGRKVELQKRKETKRVKLKPVIITPRQKMSPMASTSPVGVGVQRSISSVTTEEEEECDETGTVRTNLSSSSRIAPRTFPALPPSTPLSRAGSASSRESLDTVRPGELPVPRREITTIADIEAPENVGSPELFTDSARSQRQELQMPKKEITTISDEGSAEKITSPEPSTGLDRAPRPESPHMYISSTKGTKWSESTPLGPNSSALPSETITPERSIDQFATYGSGGTPLRSENPSQYLSEDPGSSYFRSDEPELGSSRWRSDGPESSNMYRIEESGMSQDRSPSARSDAEDGSSVKSSNKNGHNAGQPLGFPPEYANFENAAITTPKASVSPVYTRNKAARKSHKENDSDHSNLPTGETAESEMREFDRLLSNVLAHTNYMTSRDYKKLFKQVALILVWYSIMFCILNFVVESADSHCEKQHCNMFIKLVVWFFKSGVAMFSLPITLNATICSLFLNVIEYFVILVFDAAQYFVFLVFDAAQVLVTHPIGFATVLLLFLYTDIV